MSGEKIGYGRVSTLDQSTDVQEEQLLAEGCNHIFLEQISGTTRDRPQLKAAMDFARAGDAFIVMKVDRLGRSAIDVLQISKELQAKGVTLIIKDLGVDTSTPLGEFFVVVSAGYAQLENAQRRERQQLGIAKAKRDVAARKREWRGRGDAKGFDYAAAKKRVDAGVSISQVCRDAGICRNTYYKRKRQAEEAQK